MDIYYLDNFSSLSPVISIILLLGLYQLGNILSYNFKISKYIVSNKIWTHYPLISVIFILSLLSPLLYLKVLDAIIIKLVAYILFLLGIILIYDFIKKILLKNKIKKIKYENIYFCVFAIFILNFFLISLSPITHADALDYHASGAQYIINNGTLPLNSLWFHGNLVGLGELLMSIGFIIGAEQFGSLIQFSAIFSIFQSYFDVKNKKDNNNFYLIILIILSSPVIIYFISSSKPHFFQSAFFLLILKILIFDIKNFSKKNIEWLFLFFLLGSIIFMNIKFSSILSSFIIGIYFLYIFVQKKLMSLNLINYSLFILLIALVPKLYFFYTEYSASIITTILFSLPIHLEEFKLFYSDLRQVHNSGNLFNILFFPRNMSEFSTILGIGPFLLLGLSKINKQKKIILSLSFFYLFIVYFFGPRQSRFLFDPYLWVLLCIINVDFNRNFLTKTFLALGKIQIVIFLAVLFYGNLILFYGSLNLNLKEKVLLKSANGYELFKWVNQELPINSVILSSHRSIGFSNNKVISTDYRRYLKNKNKISNYLMNNKITHILFYGNNENSFFYKRCLGKKISYKKNAGIHAVRNFFHRKSQKKYNAWIYEFDIKKLPNCIN